jgi:hypothetical protein
MRCMGSITRCPDSLKPITRSRFSFAAKSHTVAVAGAGAVSGHDPEMIGPAHVLRRTVRHQTADVRANTLVRVPSGGLRDSSV